MTLRPIARPSHDDPETQPRWYLGRPSRDLAAFFRDQAGWSSTGDESHGWVCHLAI